MPSPDNPFPDRPPPADQGLKSPIARRDAGQGLVVGSDANVHFSFDGDRITRGDPSAYDVSELSANPYPGLASYTYATRAFYGGRTALVRESAQRLTSPGNEPCLVFVIGTRGSGKSSFVQAGLLPALTAVHQSLGREVRWSVRQPGGNPIAALGQALTDVGSLETPAGGWPARLRTTWALNRVLAEQTPAQQVNILVLDQFEEVFTLAGVEERLAICDMLANLGTFARLRTQVIVTLRADALPALFDVPTLFARATRDAIELRAMGKGDLAEAIRQPVRQQASLDGKNKDVDPALVEQLIRDVGGDAGRLPLMQLALRTLWDEPPHQLVHQRYRGLPEQSDGS